MLEMEMSPSVGRVLHFWAAEHDPAERPVDGGPLAAIVTHVHGPSLVNLTVFDMLGGSHSRQKVPFHWNREGVLAHSYCCWTPRQIDLLRQEAKKEAVA